MHLVSTRIESETVDSIRVGLIASVKELMMAEEDTTMLGVTSPAKSLSRNSLSELALKSALELEKAKQGREFRGDILGRFAEALSQTSRPEQAGGQAGFIRAGYHRPLVRLYRDRCTSDPGSIKEIQGFVASAAETLKDFSPEPDAVQIDQLISFCTSLHRELIHGLASENRGVLKQRKNSRATSARFSAAAG